MDNRLFWFSKKAIIYSLFVPILISIVYPKYFIPFGFYVIGSIILIAFFTLIKYYQRKWNFVKIKTFERKLFWYSFFFRLVFVFYLYSLTYFLQPFNFPFELNATDSWLYHNAALGLKDIPLKGYPERLSYLMVSRADYGFPFYLSLLYKLFGYYSFPVRVVNIVLSSFTVIFLSRISRYLFTESHARITGIIAMLFPSLIWYSAIQLKETLMIFLVISIFYLVFKIYYSKNIKILHVLIIIIFSIFLFYFRTFLAVIVIASYTLFLIFNTNIGKSFIKIFLTVLLLFFGLFYVFNSMDYTKDINNQYNDRTNFMERNLSYAQKTLSNISYSNASVIPFIVTGSFFTPFPSFLDTEERQIPIIARYQNEMVKNILYFFGLLGLIFLIRRNFKKTIGITFFILSYLFVLMSTANSFIDRFQLVNVPFIIITITVGLVNVSDKWKNGFNLYIIVLFFIHLAWTFFKLNIRGL